jgi:16S rRNA (guanine(966)-N(2))-methyltransferase RsmD
MRPTAARTLESVFDILAGEVEGRRVLDLYSGVGSYGVLALRRGADFAVFVDNLREAEKRTLRSLEQYHLLERAQVCREEVAHFLNSSARWPTPFDLVFADPPYGTVTPLRIMEAVLESGLLGTPGVFVFEHSKRQAPPDVAGLVLRKSRIFGETTVSIWDRE